MRFTQLSIPSRVILIVKRSRSPYGSRPLSAHAPRDGGAPSSCADKISQHTLVFGGWAGEAVSREDDTPSHS